jgi:hypothetical protein
MCEPCVRVEPGRAWPSRYSVLSALDFRHLGQERRTQLDYCCSSLRMRALSLKCAARNAATLSLSSILAAVAKDGTPKICLLSRFDEMREPRPRSRKGGRYRTCRSDLAQLVGKPEKEATIARPTKAMVSYEFEEIWIPKIKSRISYATALHELGHIRNGHRASRWRIVRERDAWALAGLDGDDAAKAQEGSLGTRRRSRPDHKAGLSQPRCDLCRRQDSSFGQRPDLVIPAV